MSPNPLAAGAAALRRIGALLLAAALAGVLVAGLVLPLAGLTGFTARQVSDGIENLPEELEVGEIPHTSKIFDANGNQIARFYTENREDVPLRRVAPMMRKAIVAIEDSRFFDHGAIDLEGTSRALINNLLGNDTQGGSSITQQLIKLILIEKADTKAELAAATEQSYTRKIRELQYAMSYEQNHSKRPDPGGLPQHRLLRRRGLRHQDRRAALLLGEARRPLAGAVRAAGRAGAEPDPLQPDRSTPTSRSSGATSCCSGWPSSTSSAGSRRAAR